MSPVPSEGSPSAASSPDPSDEPGGADPDRSDPTGVLAAVQVRLADHIAGDPPLPFAVLLVVGGDARGAMLELDRLPAVAGRSGDADLVVADETVSRRHVEFRGTREAIEVEDLGSSNGTTLNGNPIAGSITLHDGDLLGLGSATVLVKRIA